MIGLVVSRSVTTSVTFWLKSNRRVTTLVSLQSGLITFIKRPGAILETGSLIARLTLDDPNQCRTSALYSGNFARHLKINYSSYLAAVSPVRYVGGLGRVWLGLVRDGLFWRCVELMWCMAIGLIRVAAEWVVGVEWCGEWVGVWKRAL